MSEGDFRENERVLCYEPDMTKARVIYDAKILKIIEGEVQSEGNKRKTAMKQFLVHFQGWSTTWDRYVSVEFLLKDAPSNRVLQQTLFEEAAEATKELKKNKKKRASEATGSAMSDSPKGETAAAAAASETPRPKSISPIVEKVDSEVQFKVRQAAVDEEEEEEEVETADDEEEVEDECLVPVEITDSLKRCLEEDQERVVKRRKLNNIPSDPNVIAALEGFVRHYAAQQIELHDKHFSEKPKVGGANGNGKNSHIAVDKEADLELVRDAIHVCMEVAEGLRVMVDFYTADLLLYEAEVGQFKKAIKGREAAALLSKLSAEAAVATRDDDVVDEEHSQSHNKGSASASTNKKSRFTMRRRESGTGVVTIDLTGGSASRLIEAAEKSKKGGGGGGGGDDYDGSSSARQKTQSLDKAAKDLLDAAQKWRLFPAGTKLDEAVPSLLCGPVYLLRLYCRLPEILGRMGMPEKKTQLVVKYLENLMMYMEHEGKALFASS